MPRFRILVVLALALATCALVTTASSASAASPEAQMLHRVNHYRKIHGLRPVKLSHSLQGSARKYARWMKRHNYFGHRSRIHASSRYRRLGEILEWQTGLEAGVRRAFNCWKHSGPHRSIILDPNFTFAGAGHVSGRFKGRNATIWVMHFGRP